MGVPVVLPSKIPERIDTSSSSFLEVVAEEVEFLGTKPTDGTDFPKNDTPAGGADLEPIDDDSLPF